MSEFEKYIEEITSGTNDLGAYYSIDAIAETIWSHQQQKIDQLEERLNHVKSDLEIYLDDIKILESENTEQKKIIKELTKCLEFYGNYNWKCSTFPLYDQGNYMDDDNDYEKTYETLPMKVFGKRARKILQKYSGVYK